MKTTLKTTSKERFANAIQAAEETIKTYPRTKISFFCSKFIEWNDPLNKKCKKEREKLEKPTMDSIEEKRIELCTEKDGVIFTDSKGNYQFSKSSMLELKKFVNQAWEKFEPKLDAMLKESVQVKVINSPIELPKEFPFELERHIAGMAFTNVDPFFEEEETPKQKGK